jgi:ligand-binding sensor domain-containing protein/two-component sensor histidine kinase
MQFKITKTLKLFGLANNFLFCLCLILLFTVIIYCERLPFKVFTTENGLPQNIVNRVIRDSKGFLWFCTEDGLSRFDGQIFTNYNFTNGLPHPQINHILEADDGSFWVATYGGGVVRLANSSSPNDFGKTTQFVQVPIIETQEKIAEANRVIYLFQDRAKTIWLGTFTGLFRLEENGQNQAFHRVAFLEDYEPEIIRGITEDENNNLWIWTRNGVFRRQSDGKTTHFAISPSENYDPIRQIFCDQKGKIWIAHELAGLAVLDEKNITKLVKENTQSSFSIKQEKEIVSDWFGKNNKLNEDSVYSLFQSSDGNLWIGTTNGLIKFDGKNFQTYSKLQGLPETPYNWLAEDINGNLWATTNQGAVKITKNGFVTYQQNEGIGVRGVRSIWENENGKLQTITPKGIFHQLDGEKFISVNPNFSNDTTFEFPQNVLCDSEDVFWVATKKGLLKFPKETKFSDLAKTKPQKVNGLPSDFVMSLYEDSQKNMWIGLGNGSQKLVRWERKTNRFQYFDETIGIPKDFVASAFAEDSKGSLWIGNFRGGLLRFANEQFSYFATANGNEIELVQNLYVDKKDLLWMATKGGGVWKINDLNSDKPKFSQLTTKDGLSSDNVTTVIEDSWGRIYLGTGRGIDWIDPKSENIGHYSTIDGLNDNKIEISFRDKQNTLWFGTANSLAKFIPQPIESSEPPEVFFTKLQIDGKVFPFNKLYENEINEISVKSEESQIIIDFTGTDFASGQTLLFQHKLIGAKDEWSIPNRERSVNFAYLAPGSYQFLVRAVTSDGTISPTSATIKFTILRPIYLRWWFLTLAFIIFGLFVWQLYRFRVNRLLEIERTRTRIATDLHDDIGADLSKISLLSEVVKMQMTNGNEENNRLLTKIAETSRNSVDSMRDIVWAINPSQDSLNDLVNKMRQFAEETLVEKDIKLIFNAPIDNQNHKISMNTRRELYLIFKEAVNNASKYADCSEVKIDFEIIGKEISLQIKDNGKGFDISEDFDGNGLRNMKLRAEKLKGKFEIDSANGTQISVKFPQN